MNAYHTSVNATIMMLTSHDTAEARSERKSSNCRSNGGKPDTVWQTQCYCLLDYYDYCPATTATPAATTTTRQLQKWQSPRIVQELKAELVNSR